MVLADFQQDLFDEIATDIGDMLMKPCNRGLLFAPILPELLHSCEPALHPGELLLLLLECAARLEERTVGDCHEFCVHGIIGARYTGTPHEHDYQETNLS